MAISLRSPTWDAKGNSQANNVFLKCKHTTDFQFDITWLRPQLKKKKMNSSEQADTPTSDTPASLHFLHSNCSNWTAAPFVPANTSCDSASASNKCPSFTVCWLIYNNYTSLCSRENDQIVWDESIKSLLSGGVGSRSRSGERAQKQRRASGRRAFYRRQTA